MRNRSSNVLLVTADSLRYDARKPFRARLDHLGDAVSFERAYATGPGTTPSFPGILTGTMPLSYGGLGPLVDERPTLAEHLQAAGYHTGGFQCNPFLSTHFDYDRGFDTFEDYQHPLMGIATRLFPRGIELEGPTLSTLDTYLHLTDAIKWAYQLVAGKPRPYVSAEVVTDDVCEFLADASDPFFCWAHYMDIHHPCFPPVEYRREHDVADVKQATVAEWYGDLVADPDALSTGEVDALRRLYDAAAEYTADQVDRLFAGLREQGRYEDTLIVVTSDHGELFGDHGGYGKPERMYDELLQVPLWIANGPAYIGDAADDLVSLLDVPPLVHDAFGLDVPAAYEGRRPGVDEPRGHVLAEHEVEGDIVAGGRSADWLYEVDEIRDEERLYDCRTGFERVDADPVPDGVSDLITAVHDRLAGLDTGATTVSKGVNDDVEERLAELGYLE